MPERSSGHDSKQADAPATVRADSSARMTAKRAARVQHVSTDSPSDVANLSKSALKRGRRPRRVAVILFLLLCVLLVLSLRVGSSGNFQWSDVWRGILAMCGLGDPLPGAQQTFIELRALRALIAVGVGACLALSGGLLQGVFRNSLASPSIIGVSAGAALGASTAMMSMGGYGPFSPLRNVAAYAPVVVTGCAFLGGLIATSVVTRLATAGGRISVPTLLLVGIAVNAVAAGLLAAIQSFALRDYELSRAIVAWSFGTLEDRSAQQVVLLGIGLLVAAATIPFVALELDLFAAGEDDAKALGVHTGRVKLLALCAATLAAAVAVSVAGQIAFVGIVAPHLLRLLGGRSHRSLLPLCLLGGPVFLVGADFLQRWLLGDAFLQPGVVMSLIGGPFFLYLLVRNKGAMATW